jgi:hypothetical protein
VCHSYPHTEDRKQVTALQEHPEDKMLNRASHMLSVEYLKKFMLRAGNVQQLWPHGLASRDIYVRKECLRFIAGMKGAHETIMDPLGPHAINCLHHLQNCGHSSGHN